MSTAFKIDKHKMRHSFAAASGTYDDFAGLQRTVAQELISKIGAGIHAGLRLDVGSGTGYLTNKLANMMPKGELLALDIALPMLSFSRNKSAGKNIQYICADAENLPLQRGCLTAIYSSLALQWSRVLEATFTDFKRVLEPEGQLVFSTFTENTLWELKQSWAEVDDYCHVNSFYTADEVTYCLKRAGFSSIQVESKQYISHYASVFDLMRELKKIGAHNVSTDRNPNLTSRLAMNRMIATYEKKRDPLGIPATYDVLYVKTKRA